MAAELNISVSGRPEAARAFLEAVTQPRPEGSGAGMSVTWSGPAFVPGMTQATYELLGVLGVLSAPVSVAASLFANWMTARLGTANKQIPPVGLPDEPPRVSLTVADLESGRIARIEMSRFDGKEAAELCKALADVLRAD